MKRTNGLAMVMVIACGAMAAAIACAEDVPSDGYEVHDMRRPQPVAVTPPTCSTQEKPGSAPSDATVLFDGKDLSKWRSAKEGDGAGGDAAWKVSPDRYFAVEPKTGNIQSKDEFRDVQLHVEWCEPEGITGKSQGRGNSGIFLMGLYEVQVLDNYQSPTYPDGTVGGIYGQYPPLVNACRPQGQWQMYDIVFHAPVYQDGKVVKPARETVFLNSLLVQDDMELIGPTQHKELTKYPEAHPDKGPVMLQDHGNPVRYRNIWVRELKGDRPVPPVKSSKEHYEGQH